MSATGLIAVSPKENWRSALLPAGATLRSAINTINHAGLQIALAVDPNGVLMGTITDGDVRRALLRGLGMEAPLAQVMGRDPKVVTPAASRDLVISLMRENKLHHIPVVDPIRRVVGLHLREDVFPPTMRANIIVLMAGGLGRRLRPYTNVCPKPMLRVAGRPILEHIIERGCLEGFTQFVVCLHYLGSVIREHFGDGSRWGVNIAYIEEEEPLGTGGAIALLDPIPELPFIVANGDVLTNVRYGELLDFHCFHKAAATMAVRQHEWQHPFGVVRTEGIDIIGFEEKPVFRTQVNAGIYSIEPSALELLSRGKPFEMPALFRLLQASGRKIIGYPMYEPWLDIGRAEDLDRANLHFKGIIARPAQPTPS